MDKEVLHQKLDCLASLTRTMDVPDYRKRDVKWLDKNMSKRNSDHKNYSEAKQIVDELMNLGIRKDFAIRQ